MTSGKIYLDIQLNSENLTRGAFLTDKRDISWRVGIFRLKDPDHFLWLIMSC